MNFFFEVQSHFFQYQATHDQRKMNCFMVKSSHSIFVICTIRGAKLFLLKTHPCINETSNRMQRTSVVQLSFWVSWSYNQLLKYLRHCTVFGINGLSMILCLWSPSTPYQRCWQYHDSKLEGTTLNGGGGGGVVSYLTDLWPAAIEARKVVFFVGVPQHFCNWLYM